ncbi:hypothetical protein Ancab_006060 [Ancistrocladus abbreviatus]
MHSCLYSAEVWRILQARLGLCLQFSDLGRWYPWTVRALQGRTIRVCRQRAAIIALVYHLW